MPSEHPIVCGRDNIREYFDRVMKETNLILKITTESVSVSGDIAVERGTFKFGERIVGKYLVQWKNVNGKWLIENDISNTDE